MEQVMTFKCYLIGEDSLLIKCAEALQNQGHTILGIISPLALAQDWCANNNTHYFADLNSANHQINSSAFDYLFSVVNRKIIPQSLINKASKLAINYHDSPLPRYAGVNATCWAILNQETQHAITWHIMTDQIDAGHILKQAAFEISPEETALSLNLKCYDHAIRSFTQLIAELATNSYCPIPQNLSLRTYYGYNDKPQGNAWIDWNNTAETIERLIRALNLGPYTDRFSLPKIKIGNDIYAVEELKINFEKSTQPAGTLTNLTAHDWKIATLTHDVVIRKIRTLDNHLVSLDNISKKHQLYQGMLLVSPDNAEQLELQKLSKSIYGFEQFWVNRLLNFKAASIPWLNLNILPKQNIYNYSNIAKFSLNPEYYKKLKANINSDLPTKYIALTIWLIYLHKLESNQEIGIGLMDCSINAVHESIKSFFSEIVPTTICINAEASFLQILDMVEAELQLLKKNITYEKSLQIRSQALQNYKHNPIITVIFSDEIIDQLNSHIQAGIILVITNNGENFRCLINQKLLESDNYLFDFCQIMQDQFQILCQQIAEDPQRSIDNINLLTNNIEKTLVDNWSNAPSISLPRHSLKYLFEHQAEINSSRIALTYDNQNISYAELNTKSNQLSHYLIYKGVKAGDYVPVLGGETLQWIIAALALLKLGAAYVPIDSNSLSAYHLNQILMDCNAKFLIVEVEFRNTANTLVNPEQHNLEIIDLIIPEQYINAATAKNLDNDFSPLNTAYIMYTSGSTGKPKGVMVNHGAIARLVTNTNYIKIDSNDRIAQAANIGFDAATFEIWVALLNGACLVKAPKTLLLNAEAFAEFLQQKSITVLWLTAALFNQYVATATKMFAQLKYLLAGGDVLNPDAIKKVLDKSDLAPANFLNGYGPTENTTFTTSYRITPQILNRGRIPIGKAISNTTVFVLDKKLKPVPVGIPGELYIGGYGLANGYFNQQLLTESHFIHNPFSNFSNEKLYKTGDIVLWLPDGNLDFLGRKDSQVKIRGFRVELDAIQIQLSQYYKIDQSLVRIRENNNAEKSVIAYIVPKANHNLTITEIQTYLRSHLPKYMLPSSYVILNQLPLTPNGKVDYKSLEAYKEESQVNLSPITPAATVEDIIYNLWKQILGVESINLNESFFNVGGDSLLLMRLHADLEKALHQKISMNVLFTNPTIKDLANYFISTTTPTSNSNLQTSQLRAKKRLQALGIN